MCSKDLSKPSMRPVVSTKTSKTIVPLWKLDIITLLWRVFAFLQKSCSAQLQRFPDGVFKHHFLRELLRVSFVSKWPRNFPIIGRNTISISGSTTTSNIAHQNASRVTFTSCWWRVQKLSTITVFTTLTVSLPSDESAREKENSRKTYYHLVPDRSTLLKH